MDKDIRFLKRVVRQASKLIRPDFSVSHKDAKSDIITDVEVEVENFIIAAIRAEYPDFDIISEENFSHGTLTDNCFVIDPVDGTRNFAFNLPLWGIQVACVRGGKTVASVIYLPRLREMYSACASGAYLNGRKIAVGSGVIGKNMYCLDAKREFKFISCMQKNSLTPRSFGCIAVSMAWVASGRVSSVVFDESNSSIWDVLPGLYLVERAGGIVFNDGHKFIAGNSADVVALLLKAYEDAKSICQ